MEPARQTVHIGLFSPAPDREGVHAADCPSLATSGSGSAGKERRESQGGWPAESRFTRTPVCGPQQTPQLQSRRTSVSMALAGKADVISPNDTTLHYAELRPLSKMSCTHLD